MLPIGAGSSACPEFFRQTHAGLRGITSGSRRPPYDKLRVHDNGGLGSRLRGNDGWTRV